jgi:single-strand DNA-binding protein
MNSVNLIGRLVREVELKKTKSDKAVTNFTIAVNNAYKKDTAYFINCVAWQHSATYLDKYAKKGALLSVEGHLETRTYEKDEMTQFVTEVVAHQIKILDNRTKEKEESNEKFDEEEYEEPKKKKEEQDLPF